MPNLGGDDGRERCGDGGAPDLVALARSRPRWARVLRWVHNWVDLAAVAGAYLMTFLPQRVDGWMVAMTMPVYRTLLRRKVTAVAEMMERLLGAHPAGHSWRDVALEYWRMRAEEHWLRVRSLHRKGATVDITPEGLQHLEEALGSGRTAFASSSMSRCSSTPPSIAGITSRLQSPDMPAAWKRECARIRSRGAAGRPIATSGQAKEQAAGSCEL